jgi:hypothetical protein
MEYAGSYALFNYRLEDPGKGLEYDNLRLVRAFEHGLDPTSSEAGFVLVHIAMVKESGALVKGTVEMLEGCTAHDRVRFDDGLRTLVEGLRNVNAVMNSKSYTNQVRKMKLTCASDVEPQQTWKLHRIQDLHLRHHVPVHVPQRRGL